MGVVRQRERKSEEESNKLAKLTVAVAT